MTYQILLRLALLICVLPIWAGPGNKDLTFLEASASFEDNILVVSTGMTERSWTWTGAGWGGHQLKDLTTGREYAASGQEVVCDWNLPGLINDSVPAELVEVELRIDDDEGFTMKHIEVVSTIRYPEARLEIQHVIWAYPSSPGIRTQLKVRAMPGFDPADLPDEALPKAELKKKTYGHTVSVPSARSEHLPLNFKVRNSRRYWGYYNNPGSRLDPSRPMLREEVVQSYPVFQTEDMGWASGIGVEYQDEGLCVIKESHKCVNQEGHNTGHFYSGPGGLSVTGWGLTPDEIIPERYRECWATWTLTWSGGNDGMQLAIKQFDRARFPFFPERDMMLLSATWGPANPGGRQFGADENYVLTEIPLLADLGVDVFRIDDGYHIDPWGKNETFLPRYPDGWKNVKREMERTGMQTGLWIAALRAKQEHIIQNLEEMKVRTWMVDFDHLNKREDFEKRFEQFREIMKLAWMKTQFAVCPEYDDPRYGWYFGKEYGCIYFQNLQEAYPDHLTMVPSHVLHQNWLMSKYLNANKLQANFQTPQRVIQSRSDAHLHSISYCFALTYPFIPIFDNAAQYLEPESFSELKESISLYKKHRLSMLECYSFPIGEASDNENWSGYQFVNEDLDGGYILLFRELHNTEETRNIKLKFLENKDIRLIDLKSGHHSLASISDKGMAEFEISHPADYIWFEYTLEPERQK